MRSGHGRVAELVHVAKYCPPLCHEAAVRAWRQARDLDSSETEWGGQQAW